MEKTNFFTLANDLVDKITSYKIDNDRTIQNQLKKLNYNAFNTEATKKLAEITVYAMVYVYLYNFILSRENSKRTSAFLRHYQEYKKN